MTDNGGATDTATSTATISTAPNISPVADAGGPYTGTVGVAVVFDGSASSDADGTITFYDWDFGDGNTGTGETPSHTYTTEGTFTVSLTVTDNGGATDTATTTITVEASTGMEIIDIRIAASLDDAEESARTRMRLTSSDLELVDASTNQTVGMRFSGIGIPQGATIHNAYVQFQVDETDSGITNLIIEGEDTDNALPFESTKANISSRPRTGAFASWTPNPWLNVGEAGPDQRTPNIASVIQEIVDRPAWTGGNALVIIITGSGTRTAEAYDGVSAGAPLLHVEFSVN